MYGVGIDECYLRVAEGVREVLDLVCCEIVLVVENVVVHRLAGALQKRMRAGRGARSGNAKPRRLKHRIPPRHLVPCKNAGKVRTVHGWSKARSDEAGKEGFSTKHFKG